ncbi:glycosyl hydrolase 115 family protein [Granulicella rosea]|nr:glycosyl hydrolase 115 family protein [Granulicella rosea]
MVAFQASPHSFCIAGERQPSPLYVASEDFPGVARAVHDLAQDIGRVTGKEAAVTHSTDQLQLPPILVGTLGKSAVIDALAANGKLDVSAIRGQWESYVLQTVSDPIPGVKQAFIIAGSDKRGTIYGVYDVSENIGVSPWYWWADVPVQHHDTICMHADRLVQGPPAVKYRGIFINDEAPAMSAWTKEKFGGFNSKMYTHMFELLLRLRANYLWPAMWGSAFNEDDALNPRLADEYGIVMGTSHHEPMDRAQNEFDRRYKGDQWDYIHHPDVMENFWREGVRRNKADENIYTLGMRGRNDSSMLPNASEAENAAVLDKIIDRQRRILAEEVNPDITKVPQILAIYKEVEEFYAHGMKVPDDVTLLWSDNNFGDLRRVPTAEERKRPGGAGMYYHFDYVGAPRSYKWINTNPLPKIQEQMNLAYRYGADRIWIVNVGDLKPMELPIEFFLTMALDPKAMTKDKVADFTLQWASREFGAANAAGIADIVGKYAKYNGWRKPELLSPKTYSLVNYEEAERVEAAWVNLTKDAEAIDKKLSPDQRPAYFELVLYPVMASANLTRLYIAAGRNALYAAQGRVSANAQAKNARALFAEDKALANRYNQLLGGKWNHMMDQTHIGYIGWSDPKTNVMPEVREIVPKEGARLGVAVEGSEKAWPGSSPTAALPAIDTLGDQHRWIDVFGRGAGVVKFTARPSESWIRIDQTDGDTGSDRRLRVSIDWNAAPAGRVSGSIVIIGDSGETVSVAVPIVHVPTVSQAVRGALGNLTEAFTIPAGAAQKNIGASEGQWQPIPDYGRVASAMEVFPIPGGAAATSESAPHLEYAIYLPRAGVIEISALIAPTQKLHPDRGLRLALSIDDNEPQIVDGGAASSSAKVPSYSKLAADNIQALDFKQTIGKPGRHTLKVWMVDPDVVLEYLIVGAAKPSYFGPPASAVGPGY